MYKNRLQEYTQGAALPLPLYTTVNEGQPHDPKFRSTVVVDGRSYTSGNTFSVRKGAEQDAARVALEDITRSKRNDGCPLLNEDMVLSKSILHEFAAKMHLPMPDYHVLQREGQHPAFSCSVHFNGQIFNGGIRRNKKEAEQLGARACIVSLIRDPEYGRFLIEIMKSKSKSNFYEAINEDRSLDNAQQQSQFVAGRSIEDEDDGVSNVGNNIGAKNATFKPTSVQQEHHHHIVVPTTESSSHTIYLTISFVPQGQSVDRSQDAPPGGLVGDGEGSSQTQGSSKKKKEKSKKMRNIMNKLWGHN